MIEKQILFNGPMVRAVLAGNKTQTRRIVKLPHNNPLGKWEPTTFGGPDGGRTRKGETIPLHTAIWHTRTGDSIGAQWIVGDRLWVRETWNGPLLEEFEVDADADWHSRSRIHQYQNPAHCAYAADGGPPPEFMDADDNLRRCWRPSIHMPRWASRITLEVTGVRVERLQTISAADAIAEGISEFMGGWWCEHDDAPQIAGMTPQEGYRHLWERINGPGSWDLNPWVWAVEFQKVAP